MYAKFVVGVVLDADEVPRVVFEGPPVVLLKACELLLGLPIQPLDQVGKVVGFIVDRDSLTAKLVATNHDHSIGNATVAAASITS